MKRARRPIKVAFLVSDLVAGGLQRQAVTQAKILDGERFSVTIITAYTRPEESGELEGEVRASGLRLVRTPQVQHLRLPGKVGGLVNVMLAALTFLRVRPDVIYSHGYIHLHRQVLAALQALTKWRLVHKELNPVSLFPEHYRSLGRALAARTDVVFAVCASVRAQLISEVNYPPEKVRVLYNAVDPHYLAPAPLEPPHPCIGTVGRLDRQKNLSLLLRAAARLREMHPEVSFVVYGDGPLREPLVQQAEQQGLREAVRFAGGFRPADAPRVYGGMTLFTLVSVAEGLPNTVMEAMVYRRPVVATAVGGVPELIEQDRSGVLVELGDVEGLVRAWDDLLGDPARREAMGAAARERVLRLCSPDRVAGELAQVFEDLVGGKRA